MNGNVIAVATMDHITNSAIATATFIATKLFSRRHIKVQQITSIKAVVALLTTIALHNLCSKAQAVAS